MTLPPLPEPAVQLPLGAYSITPSSDKLHNLYTEAQMLAYGAAVVEACADKCESLDELHPAPIVRVFYQCAHAIRSLLKCQDGTTAYAKTTTEGLGVGLLTGSEQEKNLDAAMQETP